MPSPTRLPARVERLRIGLVGHHVGPIAPPFVGGVEAFTYALAEWLAARGHAVTLFAPSGSEVPGVMLRPLDLRAPLTVQARADVSMPPAAFMDAHHAYQALMTDLVADGPGVDVLHLHSLHYLPVAMASLLACPVMLTLHTPPTPWLEAALAARPHAIGEIVTVSAAAAELWAPTTGPLPVVPNGIDLHRWRPGPGGPDAVWSGRLVAEKAPHLAIDAARAADAKIVLAGPRLDPAYFATEVEPRLGADARYVGHLDHDRLRELVASSAVAVVSSVWQEPFGLVAAEAMAAGTPVAAFAAGALTDVVDAESGCLAPPGDVAALAAAIRAAARLDRRAVRRSARRFDIERMGGGYERRYHALVRGRARPPRAGRAGLVTV